MGMRDKGAIAAFKNLGFCSANFRHNMNTLQTIDLQLTAINDFFAELKTKNERLVYALDETTELEALAA